MSSLELAKSNLTSPMVLAFVLGMAASTVRSNLRLPEAVYKALSIYLLLAIGLKGGVALGDAGLDALLLPAIGTLALGLVIPVAAYATARRIGRFDAANAAALAAHYGSVSVVTFVSATLFLQAVGMSSEPFMPALVALLEVPAIIVALTIAERSREGRGSLSDALREVVFGSSIVLLIGGVAIGYTTGHSGLSQVEAFFVAPFKGALTLFMLELGIVAAQQLRTIKGNGMFLVGFGLLMPMLQGALGVWVGKTCGLSEGGSMLLGTMAASASYIAAPAAVRIALPQANPALYLTSALGITFPFNLAIGIPLYSAMAHGNLPQQVMAALSP